MNYYILSIFLNYLFFVISGIFYHLFMGDGSIDAHIWVLIPIGGLFYFPIYLVTNIPVIRYMKDSRAYSNLYILPTLLSLLLSFILIKVNLLDEYMLILLAIAQLLTSLFTHLVKYGMKRLFQ